MPPKPPAKGGKAGGEPDLAAQLPSDLPAECPFPFTWHACGVVVTCSDPSHLAALKEALAKLQGQQQLAVADLIAKLDPAGPLAQEVSAAQAAAGGADVSSLPASLLAQVLDSAFAADQQLAWKQQLVQRRAAVTAAEATLAAATQAEAAAAATHEAAAQAAAEAAAAAAQHGEEGAPAPAAAAAVEGEEGAEESPLQVAKAALEAAQASTSAAAEGLAAAQQQLAAPWDCYQTYWLEGLPTSVEGLAAVVAAGVPVRSVLVVAPPAPATDAAGAPAAGEGAAEGSSAAAAAAPADPLALAAAAAEWGSPLAGVAVLVVGQGTPSTCLSTGASPASSSSILSSPAWIATLAAEAAAAKAAADAAAATNAGGKGGAGKAPAAKGGKGGPASDAALLELSGLQEVARALATVPSVAKLYDEWKAAATVYQLAGLETPLGVGEQQGGAGGREAALYRHLLSTVEPERQSVPVLLHAMLEQVCRNVQGQEWAAEADAGLTLAQAEAAIAAVFDRVLLPAGPLLAPAAPEKQQLPCISQSDELAAAAYGIGSGQVHVKQAGSAAAAGEEGVTGLYGLTPEEVDAAERHLLSLVQRPGQLALPPTAGDDTGADSALARRLQQQQLQEHCKGLPLAAVERLQLQQALAGLLPPAAAAAHGEGVLGRVHLERLDARALQQALLQASVELPSGASRHYPAQDVTLVAYFADATADSGRKLMPVALNFHQYWQEVLVGYGAAPALPGKVYRMHPRLAEQGWERRWLYTAAGGVVSRGPEGLLSLHKDDLCLKLSAAGDGTYQLLGTLKYGTTLAAGVRPAPKQQPTSAAAAASTAEADPPAEAPEAGEGAAAAAAAEGEAERAEPAAEEAGAAAAAGVTPGCVPSPGYIQVVTPDGVLVEVSTSGVVLMAPLNQEHLTVPAARGVQTLGAPIPPGHLGALLPEGSYDWQALLPDGSLIKHAPVAVPGVEPVTTILSPSGEVAQLQRREVAGQQMVGWVRSTPDGRRMWVADETCLEQLRAAAAAAAGARAAAKAAAEAAAAAAAEAAAAAAAEAASKKGGKGAKLTKSPSKGERATSASSASGKDGDAGEGEAAGAAGGAGGAKGAGGLAEGLTGDVVVAEAPLRAVQVTDAESGAVVHTREDGLLLVEYADGSKLLQDAAGSRLASQEGGCWQFQGQGVPHVTHDAHHITCTPCPGLTITWDRLTSTVSLTLPGSALLAVGVGGTAAYSPAANPSAVQLLLDLTASPALGGGGLGLQEAVSQEECRGLLGVGLEAGSVALWDAQDCHLYLSPGAQVATWVCGEAPASVEPPPEPAAPAEAPAAAAEGEDAEAASSGLEAGDPAPEAADGSGSPVAAAAEAAPAAAAVVEEPVRPVAASVPPRLFVIHPGGDGFELLDPAVFSRYLAEAGPECTVKVTPVNKGAEAGSQRYSFLKPYCSSSRDLQALPLAESVVPVASAAAGAAPLGSLRRPDTVNVPAPGGSGQLRLPRIAAVSPAPGAPAGLATRTGAGAASSSSKAPVVLVGREVIQVPEMTPEVRAAAEAALSSCRAAAESAQQQVAARVPPSDGRTAEEQQEEADVSALLQQLALSLPGLAAAAAELEGEVAAAAAAQAAAADEAAGAAALADAEKLASKRKPRTKKVGPYDHCQQLPVPGATMSYWASPEGLEAQKAHGDQLQQSLTRDKLRPVKPPPAVTAGKQLQPGVYLAASTQLRDDTAAAAAAAEAAAAEAAGEGEAVDPLMVSMRSTHQSQFPLTGSGELTSSLLRQSLGATIKAGGTSSSTAAAGRGGGASGLQSTAAMVAAAAPDYGYPSMGYSTKVQSPQTLQARSRGAGLDVYGNVRAVPPALPASHLREEARRSLNAGYLAREGGPLRGASTASASLIKYYGRAGQQLAIHPGSLAFTGLQPGATGRTTVSLLNTSATPARFHVVQPAPPLRVLYKPGPVPPGLEVPLTIEFTAATPGAFHGEIVVKGEVNVLTLTVDALVEEPAAPPPAATAAATEEPLEEAVA